MLRLGLNITEDINYSFISWGVFDKSDKNSIPISCKSGLYLNRKDKACPYG
jgi:hypothetical protein